MEVKLSGTTFDSLKQQAGKTTEDSMRVARIIAAMGIADPSNSKEAITRLLTLLERQSVIINELAKELVAQSERVKGKLN